MYHLNIISCQAESRTAADYANPSWAAFCIDVKNVKRAGVELNWHRHTNVMNMSHAFRLGIPIMGNLW